MNNRIIVTLAAALSIGLPAGIPARSGAEDEHPGRNIPQAFATLEYLAGRWQGQGVPKNDPANAFRGWTETHSWAWVFRDGSPVAMKLTVEGGRILASAKLTFDPARKLYHLEGALPPSAGGPIHLEGTLDRTGKRLVLESVGKMPHFGGTVRLSIGPNANFIRYTIREDRKEPGGSQFRPFIEVGVTKEGESFASGATAATGPKCIITGAASAMTVTYEGTSYPVCCTGCRDEFLENPKKYIQKASLLQKAEASKRKGGPSAPKRVSRRDDAFADDVAETEQENDAKPKAKSADVPAMKTEKRKSAAPIAKGSSESKRTAKKPDATTASKGIARSASLLKIGQNLEKNGSNDAALSYYRRILKEYPDTSAAKTARERIKAIDLRSK
jgi:YHS domain-containing protein